MNRELDLSQGWWNELCRSLDTVAATPTHRVCVSPELLTSRVRTQLGINLDPQRLNWTTIHGDVHWANLHTPSFALLDWEGWGRGPAGVDAATLYCYSLRAPNTARRVFDTFRDTLTGPDGRSAQLYAIARLLSRAEKGDHPDLIGPLRTRAALLTATSSMRG